MASSKGWFCQSCGKNKNLRILDGRDIFLTIFVCNFPLHGEVRPSSPINGKCHPKLSTGFRFTTQHKTTPKNDVVFFPFFILGVLCKASSIVSHSCKKSQNIMQMLARAEWQDLNFDSLEFANSKFQGGSDVLLRSMIVFRMLSSDNVFDFERERESNLWMNGFQTESGINWKMGTKSTEFGKRVQIHHQQARRHRYSFFKRLKRIYSALEQKVSAIQNHAQG